MTLTLFDIAGLAIIFMSSFFGFFKGMISVVLGLVSLGISIWAAPYINPYITEVLIEYIRDDITVKLLSYFLSFILSYCIIAMTLSPMPNLFGSFSNSILDKVLGIIAGASRGLIITSTIFFLLTAPIVARAEKDALEECLPKALSSSQFYQIFKSYISLERIQSVSQDYFKTAKDIKAPDLQSIEDIFKQSKQ